MNKLEDLYDDLYECADAVAGQWGIDRDALHFMELVADELDIPMDRKYHSIDILRTPPVIRFEVVFHPRED